MDIGFLSESPIHLKQVIKLSDENKRLLGMLPYKAFEEAAEENRIIVAWKEDELVGYILFRISKRKRDIHITHFCVSRALRRSGVAENIFAYLKSSINDYRIIRLHCRSDYKLEDFWSGLGMFCKGQIPGRSNDRKPLKVWALQNPNDQIQAELDLFGKGVEQVVVDANVVYDLSANDNGTDSPVLMGDWLKDSYKLCVTPELASEIFRSEDTERNAMQLRFVNSNFSDVDYDLDFYKRAKAHLCDLYNPEDENSRSDLKHLAYCLAARAPYFVTRDEWIRKKGDFRFESRKVLALRPSELAILHHAGVNNEAGFFSEKVVRDVEVQVVEPSDIEELKHRFLSKKEKANQLREKLHSSLAVDGSCSGVLTEGCIKRAIYVSFPHQDAMRVPVLRIEKNNSEDLYLNYILSNIIFEACKKNMNKVEVLDIEGASNIELFLSEFGFIYADNKWFKALTDVGSEFFEVLLAGKDDYFREKFIWPSKGFALGLNNYIVPIRPAWAKELFDREYAASDLFGADKALHLGAKNVYYRSTRGPKIEPCSRILWYVSESNEYRGSGSIRACSLIDEVESGSPAYLYNKNKRFGVYGFKDVEGCSDAHGDAMAIRFSHTESFSSGINFQKAQDILRSFGYGRVNFAGPLVVRNEVFERFYRELAN